MAAFFNSSSQIFQHFIRSRFYWAKIHHTVIFLDFILDCCFFSPQYLQTPLWNVHNLILPEKHSCWWEALFSREVFSRHLTAANFILGFEYQNSNIDLDIVFHRKQVNGVTHVTKLLAYWILKRLKLFQCDWISQYTEQM